MMGKCICVCMQILVCHNIVNFVCVSSQVFIKNCLVYWSVLPWQIFFDGINSINNIYIIICCYMMVNLEEEQPN